MNGAYRAGTIVFVSFENRFAPVGGLAAVMRMFPPVLSDRRDTIMITPFFKNIPSCITSLDNGDVIDTGLRGTVVYNGRPHSIGVLEAAHQPGDPHPGYREYLVRAGDFFLATENPYVDAERESALFHDSYFLCKSVPVVLGLVQGIHPPPYVPVLQDWETALAVETITIPETRCILALHNTYDYKLPDHPGGKSVLELATPLMHGVYTVSRQYAWELTRDVLPSKVVARRLQPLFDTGGIKGIDNGNFLPLQFPAPPDDVTAIALEKKRARAMLASFLASPDAPVPTAGGLPVIGEKDVPVFLLFGRDDPKQKGYDVAAAAIHDLLSSGHDDLGQFIFTIVPGPDGGPGLSPVEALAKQFPGHVALYSYRLYKGYREIQKGMTYVIMPSYYEPFGAANEAYACGVPVIARATGGLVQQVCPRNFEALPETTRERVRFFHGDDHVDAPTGFLYREHSSTETPDNWRYILGVDYDSPRPAAEPVSRLNPLFWSMVEGLKRVLLEASAFYRDDREGYLAMVANGIRLFTTFTWEHSADRFLDVFSHVVG